MPDIKTTLTSAVESLSGLSDSARLDCEWLLCFVLDKPRSYLHSWPEKMLSQDETVQFEKRLNRRVNGEPIAHILGERGFWSLNLKVTADTLIPRPETERLVELALGLIPNQSQWNILDLGTGTGAIALSLAMERPACFISATDQSLAALDVAKQNAMNNKISNIEFIHSNWFAKLKNKKFDVIVSNPPYVEENDPHLQQGDVRFEPLSALTAGEDGLDDIRTIIKSSQAHLTQNGVLLIEHGYNQAESVCDLLNLAGFNKVKNFKDDNDIPRISIGYISN